MGRVDDVERLAFELGGSLPTEYLGLPLGAKHKATRVWDGMEWKKGFVEGWHFGKCSISHSYQKCARQHAHLLNVSLPAP